MQRLLIIFAVCVGLLPACVPVQVVNEAKPKIESKDSTLESWWSFFGDTTLDKFVSSAISLNSKYEVQKSLSGINHSYDDLRNFYRTPETDLILAVTRHYIDYRYVQNQIYILTNYIDDRDYILKKIGKSKDKLVNKIESDQVKLLNKKLALEGDKVKLLNEITILTNLLPEYINQILEERVDLPDPDIMPILASPVFVIANSPDIVAAFALFSKNINYAQQYNIFPNIMVNRFLGISDNVFLNDGNTWKVVIGNAAQNLDFSKINSGRSGKNLRSNILEFVVNFEHMVVSYAHIQEQYNVLNKTAQEAGREYLSVKESRSNSYIDSFIETSERAYNARLAALRAKYEGIKIANDLYEVLGVN